MENPEGCLDKIIIAIGMVYWTLTFASVLYMAMTYYISKITRKAIL